MLVLLVDSQEGNTVVNLTLDRYLQLLELEAKANGQLGRTKNSHVIAQELYEASAPVDLFPKLVWY